jgi:hypothetical protein
MISNVDCKSYRAQEKTRRILELIDLLASFAYPKTLSEIWDHVHEQYGCRRTLLRDLTLLYEMRLVDEVGTRQTGRRGPGVTLYALSLKRTERLQEVAIVLESETR